MPDVREWRGIRKWIAAEVLTDTAETFECGTPFEVAGVAKISRSTPTSSEAHYYDNEPANVVDSTGADEISIEASALPLDIFAKVTGQVYDETKAMLVEGARENKYFAMGYITKLTDGTEVFVWRLKGKFNIPDSEHNTENDGTEALGQTLTYTGVNTKHKFANGKTAKAVNVNSKLNTAVKEDEFFTEVQTPDTVPAVSA